MFDYDLKITFPSGNLEINDKVEILIVEDTPLNQIIIQNQLNHAFGLIAHEFFIATNIDAALKIIDNQSIGKHNLDLIILDGQLEESVSGKTGETLIWKIYKNNPELVLKIVGWSTKHGTVEQWNESIKNTPPPMSPDASPNFFCTSKNSKPKQPPEILYCLQKTTTKKDILSLGIIDRLVNPHKKNPTPQTISNNHSF